MRQFLRLVVLSLAVVLTAFGVPDSSFSQFLDSTADEMLLEEWVNGRWVASGRFVGEYDDRGNQIAWEFSEWQEDWLPTWRYSAEFEGPNRTRFTMEQWDAPAAAWSPIERTSFDFEAGNETGRLTELWSGASGGNGAWTPASRSISEYDDGRLLATRVNETWEGSGWIPSDRLSQEWDSLRRLLTRTNQYWVDSHEYWQLFQEQSFEYVGETDRLEFVRRRSWTGSLWEQERTEYRYSESRTVQTEYSNGVPESRRTTDYNEAGNPVRQLSEKWDGDWIPLRLEETTYDPPGNLRLAQVVSNWDADAGIWVPFSRTTSIYESSPTSSEAPADLTGPFQIEIFPNPVSSTANILLPDPGVGAEKTVLITVVDVTGRTMLSFPTGSRHVALPVEGLAPGVYIVRAETNDFAASRLVVVGSSRTAY